MLSALLRPKSNSQEPLAKVSQVCPREAATSRSDWLAALKMAEFLQRRILEVPSGEIQVESVRPGLNWTVPLQPVTAHLTQ